MFQAIISEGLVKNQPLDLRKLFAGSEGTLGVVTRLKFRLLDKPPYDSLVVAFFDDILSSAKAVQKILPMNPAGIEIMDKSLLQLAKETDEHLRNKIPDGIDNVLMIEFDAFDKDESLSPANKTRELLITRGFTQNAYLAVSDEEKEKFWGIRKAAVPILYKLKGEKKILALIEDAAVPIQHLVDYFEGIYNILNRHHVKFVLYGHIAKGLLHTRPLLNLKDTHDVEMLKILGDEVFELVHSLGGSVSGEHGDGRLRSAYIKKQYPGIYDLFLKTKHILDEKNILNPEIKTIHDPNQMKKNLRFGADYQIILNFPLLKEIEKCHGCSKCTTVTTATRMCPVYKFTRDESASPKAKANILQALITGAIKEKSLYEKEFYQVMQNCINCGSCYKECPSNVNIPQMAIAAKAGYIKRFGSSIQDKLLVNAEFAGKSLRKFAGILKPLADAEFSRKIGEQFLGISSKRELISFSEKSLFEIMPEKIHPLERGLEIPNLTPLPPFPEGKGGKRSKISPSLQGRGRGLGFQTRSNKVLFFTGCYAGYIKPEIGVAAIKILKQIGLSVFIPKQHCCGLPMISKGMIKGAKDKILKNLRKWGSLLNEADYIAVTCSSCGFSLMQEWAYLFDNHEIKMIQRKTVHISRLVNQHLDKLEFKQSDMKLSYHTPCHLKVQTDASCSIRMLSKIVKIEDLKSHCCGMAGAWGFSADNYDLSCKIASDMIHKLNISDSVIGVTDCPTCRLQMEHLSRKEIKHPIEILAELLNI